MALSLHQRSLSDQRVDEPLPRHQHLHLGQEPLAAGHLFLVLVFCLGERDLIHLVARSGGGKANRFYPADGRQTAVAGCVQPFPNKPVFLQFVPFVLCVNGRSISGCGPPALQ